MSARSLVLLWEEEDGSIHHCGCQAVDENRMKRLLFELCSFEQERMLTRVVLSLKFGAPDIYQEGKYNLLI